MGKAEIYENYVKKFDQYKIYAPTDLQNHPSFEPFLSESDKKKKQEGKSLGGWMSPYTYGDWIKTVTLTRVHSRGETLTTSGRYDGSFKIEETNEIIEVYYMLTGFGFYLVKVFANEEAYRKYRTPMSSYHYFEEY